MARLTRTQKYAELRDSLSNDKESSLQTKDLSDYEDRLNSISELLSPLTQKDEDKPVYAPPADNDPKYTWTDFEETPVDDLLNSFKNNEIDQQLQNIANESNVYNSVKDSTVRPAPQEVKVPDTKPLINEPVYEAPVIDTPIIDLPKEDIKPLIDEDLYMNPQYSDPFSFDEAEKETKAPVEEKPQYSAPEAPQQNDFPGYYHPQQTDLPELSTEEVEKPAAPQQNYINLAPNVETVDGSEADNHPVQHNEEQVSSYISSMIDEVGEYNKKNGDMTITQITNNMVNEIRHPEDVKQDFEVPSFEEEIAAPVSENPTEDEEFSNTVSMEIAKIMDEIEVTGEKPQVTAAPIEEAVIEPVEEAVIEPVEEAVVEQAPVEEHPVLAKALEEEKEEEVVEIKNLKELEAEPVRDTISNTIPFVVTTEGDEEEIEDDDEEGSNTILNIILIILIIVLVAVLGLIVFYILKTKGII